jgi:hypothetical protein
MLVIYTTSISNDARSHEHKKKIAFQVSPACPSETSSLKSKTLKCSDLKCRPQNFYLFFNALVYTLERKLVFFFYKKGIIFMKLNLERYARKECEQYGTLDLLKNLLEDVG